MPLATGARLGAYEILAPLGAGGMGEVYRARHLALGREVAIKVLPDRLAQDQAALARFTREARLVAALSHPNILAIHDFALEGVVPFAVTELLDGETLRKAMGRGPLPWRRAAEVAAAIAEGLAAAHAKGIVHRDLKPDNVFLTTAGGVKILDFGLAHPMLVAMPGADDDTAGVITQPGVVMGTVAYMSPEQARGGGADPRSDIFSLGSVLYETLTGERPFDRLNTADTLAAVLHEEAPRLPDAGMPADLDRVISRCLAKAPDHRYASARELSGALRDLLTASTPAATATGRPRPRSLRVRPIDSLAVLPFENAGGETEAEYLADGVTETLINSLTQLKNLHVTARATCFRYKGRKLHPQLAGQELGVRAVLTGSVAARGDALVVQADLVDVAGGGQLWGEQYNRTRADIFAVQEDIADRILDKLRWRLTGEERQRVRKRHTEDVEAYQLYLKGRFQWNRRTPDRFRRAIELFHQAIEQDPTYALAHSGLADCYSLMSFYGALPPKDGYARARAAAQRALSLDPTLAEAHASMACVRMHHDWDTAAAERDLKDALALNPRYPTAHQWYAQAFTIQGRQEEALSEMRRAQALDPLSFIIGSALAIVLYHARRFEESIREHGKTLELEPDFVLSRALLGMALVETGHVEDAIRELEAARASSGGAGFTLGMLGHVYGRAGRAEDGRRLEAELAERAARSYMSSFWTALVASGRRDEEATLSALERAYEERSDWLPFAGVSPPFDFLRGHPRFVRVVEPFRSIAPP
jgi:eukaryotic-like serine/threonine-protein kinase